MGSRMGYFDGKVVLITGAAGGLGSEMVRQLGRTKARMILTDVTDRPPDHDPRILAYIRADVGSREGCRDLVARCYAVSPVIDILINNAGLATVGCFVDVPDDKWQAQIEVNLVAPMMLTKLVLPGMMARRSGHIVNMSSVGGHVGLPKTATYAATKFGLRGFGTALRGEVAPHNICVTNVYPFFTRTPILDSECFGGSKPKQMPAFLIDEPAAVISHALEGVARRKAHVFPSGRARVIGLLARISPAFAALLTQQFAKRME